MRSQEKGNVVGNQALRGQILASVSDYFRFALWTPNLVLQEHPSNIVTCDIVAKADKRRDGPS